jgi:flagellar hook-length control protein FliK
MQIVPNFDLYQAGNADVLNQPTLPDYASETGMFHDMLSDAMGAGDKDIVLQSYKQAESSRQAAASSAPTLEELKKDAEEARKRSQKQEDAEKTEIMRMAMTGGRGEDVEAPQMLKMTKEDLDKLRDTLSNNGFSGKDIQEFEDMVNSDSGLTWGDFMRKLASVKLDANQTTNLSLEQNQHLTHMMHKLGLNTKQTESTLHQLTKGDVGDVLKQLQALAEKSDASVSRSEFQSLLEACGLDEENQKKLLELFGDGDGLSGEALGDALAQLKQALTEKSKKTTAETAELMSKVSDALRNAADDASEASLSMRFVQVDEQNQKNSIKQTMGIGKEIADKAEAERTASQNGSIAQPKQEQAATQAQQDQTQNKNSLQTGDLGQQARDSFVGKGPLGQENANSASEDSAHSGGSNQERDGLEDLFSRFQHDSGADAKADKVAAQTSVQTPSQFESTAKNASGTAANNARETLTRQALEQVQQGVLKTLNNGAKQLTLQLSPADLGQLNVILQVKNKEVHASIRAENHDTAKMLTENMAALKTALEQQGLKVAKVEVQTGLLSDDQLMQQYFSQDNHNGAQEQNERAQHMGRMRLLRGEAASVARDMQSDVEQASIAQTGISIIA